VASLACAENPSETVLTFLYISSQPHVAFEPDYVVRKPRKRRFQHILSERKYSQLFTHESNIFLLKQLHQFIDAVQRWRQSIYRLLTDGWKENKASHILPVHSVHLADIITVLVITCGYQNSQTIYTEQKSTAYLSSHQKWLQAKGRQRRWRRMWQGTEHSTRL